MKTKISPAIVGMFIVGALLLAVIGFLSFGGSNIFSKPARFLVYFDESVSGLDPGAAVKISGVRVGRVAAINVRYDAASKRSVVQTICELDRNVLSDQQGRAIDLTSPAVLQDLIDHGLRARLNFTGITGLLFVELDFEDPRLYPANPERMADVYPIMPAIPSPINELQSSVIDILANLKKVDFPGLGKELKVLLAATSKKVDDFDVKGLSERVGRAADAVQAYVSSPEAKQSFAKLNAAIDAAKAAMTRVDAQVGPAGEELQRTLTEAQTALKSLDTTALTTRHFIQAQGQLSDEVAQTLQQVADAAASLQRLADAIERDPSSLLVGKRKAAPEKP